MISFLDVIYLFQLVQIVCYCVSFRFGKDSWKRFLLSQPTIQLHMVTHNKSTPSPDEDQQHAVFIVTVLGATNKRICVYFHSRQRVFNSKRIESFSYSQILCRLYVYIMVKLNLVYP